MELVPAFQTSPRPPVQAHSSTRNSAPLEPLQPPLWDKDGPLAGKVIFLQVFCEGKDVSQHYWKMIEQLGGKATSQLSKRCDFMITNQNSTRAVFRGSLLQNCPIVNVMWLELLYKEGRLVPPEQFLVRVGECKKELKPRADIDPGLVLAAVQPLAQAFAEGLRGRRGASSKKALSQRKSCFPSPMSSRNKCD